MQAKKRLLLITNDYPYGIGENFLEAELSFLTEQFEITLVTLTQKPEQPHRPLQEGVALIAFPIPSLKQDPLSILRAMPKALFHPLFRRECSHIFKSGRQRFARIRHSFRFLVHGMLFEKFLEKEILSKKHYDVIYSYWSTNRCLGALLTKKQHPRSKYVTRLHGYDLYPDRSPVGWQPFKLWMDEQLDGIYFAAQRAMNAYEAAYRLSPDPKRRCFRLGVPSSGVAAPIAVQQPFHLLSCSHAVPVKRIERIIEALALTDAPIRWTHIGDGPCFDALRRLADALLGKKANVTYHFPGYMTPEQIYSFYRQNAVSCFITTTESEGGCPVSIQEAMSFGVPILATDVGGITEMLENYPYPMLPLDATPQEIAQAINGLITMSTADFNALATASLNTWDKLFTASKNHRAFLTALLSLTERPIRNKKRLLLITNGFPFGNGETFITPELPYLAEQFDVTILSPNLRHLPKRNIVPGCIKHRTFTLLPLKKMPLTVLRILSLALKNSVWKEEVSAVVKTHHRVLPRLLNSFHFFCYATLVKEQLLTPELFDLREYDFIYSFWSNHTTLAALFAKEYFPHLKVVTRLHRYDLYDFCAPSNRQPFKTWMDERLDLLAFLSNMAKNDYEQRLHLSPHTKRLVCPLGTDNPHPVQQLQHNAIPLLVSCSFLAPVKRVHLIIEALAKLTLPIRWVHLGDGPLRAELESMAQEKLKGKENIQYSFAGQLANEDILTFYRTHDITAFITTSESEGVPVSMMEALSFGIPMIATEVGGIPEMLEGYSVPLLPANPTAEDIAQKITGIVQMNEADTLALRKESYALWQNRYSAETNYHRFIDALQKL